MSRFKEIVRGDIKRVFLNDEEFADICVVDGKEMRVVTDDNEVIERSKKQTERTDGIYKRQFMIYVAAEDFGRLPAVGRELKFNHATFRVVDAVREGDVYSITLGANRS